LTLHDNLRDAAGYLSRMSASVQEKAKVAQLIDPQSQRMLDVGCADGTLTGVLAVAFPRADVLGIDLDADFVSSAVARQGPHHARLSFERVYLRELLLRPERYDAVTFVSVLHEFAAYGQGISSIVKAIADAHELLRPDGRIIIRDMIPAAYTWQNRAGATSAIAKVRAVPRIVPQLSDFEATYGKLDTLHGLNHFLLKYFYTDNWQHENAEAYMPMSIEQYEEVFRLLGMDIVHRDCHRLAFLENKWRADFGFTDTELASLTTTCILAAQKTG
jgi:SAM-dependent methyltransferase